MTYPPITFIDPKFWANWVVPVFPIEYFTSILGTILPARPHQPEDENGAMLILIPWFHWPLRHRKSKPLPSFLPHISKNSIERLPVWKWDLSRQAGVLLLHFTRYHCAQGGSLCLPQHHTQGSVKYSCCAPRALMMPRLAGQRKEEWLPPLYFTICRWHVMAALAGLLKNNHLLPCSTVGMKLAPKGCITAPLLYSESPLLFITQAWFLGPGIDESSRRMSCL